MAEIKFEEALKKLEKIVSDLEKENVTLDKAILQFQEGMKLAKLCAGKIKEAEEKIEILAKDEKGRSGTKAFDGRRETSEKAGERECD